MSPQFVRATRVTCPHGALSLVTRVRPKARRVSHVPWRALACRHDVNHITQKARRVSHVPRRALACRHDVIHISPGSLSHLPAMCGKCPPGLSPQRLSHVPPARSPMTPGHVSHVPPACPREKCQLSHRSVFRETCHMSRHSTVACLRDVGHNRSTRKQSESTRSTKKQQEATNSIKKR